MSKPMVRLNNGKEVSLEEFITWTPFKQNLMTVSAERKKEWYKKIAKNRLRPVNTPIGTFASMSEAAAQIGIPYSRLRKFLLSKEYPDYSFVNPTLKDFIEPKEEPTQEELDATRIRRGMAHRRGVITPIGEFSTVREACKALGITKDSLSRLIHNTAYPQFSYANPKHIDPSKLFHKVYRVGPKKTVTPIGTFPSKIAAANALGILKDQLGKLMITNPTEYYYADDNVNKSTFKK